MAVDSTQRQCEGTTYSSATVTSILLLGDSHAPVTPDLLPRGMSSVMANPRLVGLCLYKATAPAGDEAVEERSNAPQVAVPARVRVLVPVPRGSRSISPVTCL